MSSYNWESEFKTESFKDLSEQIVSRFMHIAVNDKAKLDTIQAIIAQEETTEDSKFFDGELLILAIYYVIYKVGDLEKAKKMLKNKYFSKVFLLDRQGFYILLKLLTEKNDQQLMAAICYNASCISWNLKGLLVFPHFLHFGFEPEYEFYREFMYLVQSNNYTLGNLNFLFFIFDENNSKIINTFLDFALENNLLIHNMLDCNHISKFSKETFKYIQEKLNKKKNNLDKFIIFIEETMRAMKIEQ